jgi:hypothetical protein
MHNKDQKKNPIRIPIVRAGAKTYPVRCIDPVKILDHKPGEAVNAILLEAKDYNNLLWAGMVALAKDIYSRMPEGSHEFRDFVSSLGLQIYFASGEAILAEKEF